MFDLNVESDVMQAVILGSVVGILIGLVTEYYTGIEPVMGIKTKAFHTLERCPNWPSNKRNRWIICRNDVTMIPILLIAAGIFGAFKIGGDELDFTTLQSLQWVC